jgi:hypothetical protein
MLNETQIQTLKQKTDIHKLSHREERYNYLGLLKEYQIQPEVIAQKLDYSKLNPRQHFLFKRVLHGLKVYNQNEIEKLHWEKKKRIKNTWLRAQNEVNIWKQIICAKKANKIFELFKNSPLGKQILEVSVEDVDPSFINTFTFKELNIKYEDLILFYMSKGLLPKNFLNLKPNEN